MISLTANSVRRGIPPVVPGPVRIQDGPGTILLTSRFSSGRSVNYLGYRIFVDFSWGGQAYPLRIQWH
jgi:hypothetical protein